MPRSGPDPDVSFETPRGSVILPLRASGGMADAHGSGPCVLTDVGVQLPPRPLNGWISRRVPEQAPATRLVACRVPDGSRRRQRDDRASRRFPLRAGSGVAALRPRGRSAARRSGLRSIARRTLPRCPGCPAVRAMPSRRIPTSAGSGASPVGRSAPAGPYVFSTTASNTAPTGAFPRGAGNCP
jgi:hypothetical protein